jgi:hypothetical protein
MIESYDFGKIVVDGRTYSADLVLLPGRINSSWWRQEGHRLSVADLQDVLAEEIEILVIGTGFFGLMRVSRDVEQAAAAKSIRLVVQKTKPAVRSYNELAVKKKTAGAFHLTC